MNKLKKVLLVLVVFLFCINLTYAQDYAIFSGKFYDLRESEEKIQFEFYNGTYSICENEERAIPILVVNKDAKTDNKYNLDVAGATWANLNVKEFSLPKKQNGVVFLSIKPGQDTSGNYDIKINSLSSVGDIKKDLSIDIDVEKCYSLSIELDNEEDKVCGGTKKQYSGEVINGGTRKSGVVLTLNGPTWVGLDESAYSVASNDKQKFELNVDVPSNSEGIFDIVISGIGQDNPIMKSEKNLKIETVPKYNCYKADIEIDAKIKNYYSNEYVSIKIRNNGIKMAEYDISLEAPDWISIEPEELSINPGQVANLNLNINPNAEVAEGTYRIKINIKFEDVTYSKDVDVILSKENRILKSVKSFLIFYKYYIYVVLFIAIVLFILRKQIGDKIKTRYRNYKIRQARLKALELARKARLAKIKR